MKQSVLLLVLMFISLSALAKTTIGAVFDLTGGLNIYGIQQSRALHLAVANINANGGLLGEELQAIEYDAESKMDTYNHHVDQLTHHNISALFAGLTSSSRELLRPLARKAKIPYFYSSLYEGGACDKYTFITGPTASQQMSVLIEWGVKKFGKKIYVMAPQYNFGTISARWVSLFAEQFNAQVVGVDFFPLDVTDYSVAIKRIEKLQPDFVVALPVGSNQNNFLEQYQAAGLKDIAPIVSSNYGSGNQQMNVSEDVGEGIIASQGYFMWITGASNQSFVNQWEATYGLEEPIVSVAVDVWNAVHLWAKAVEKSGTTNTEKVIAALESDMSFMGPNGLVSIHPGSHHLKQNIYIVRGDRNSRFETIETYTNVAPAYEEKVCDLLTDPSIKKHYIPI